MGHAHVGEGQVVPAGGLGVVAVVGAQVGVQVVGTRAAMARSASGRSRSGRAGWRQTIPWPASGRWLAFMVSPTFSVVNSRLSLICCSVRPMSRQAVVAHERRRVAVQAVVDEQLGAVLQAARSLVLLGALSQAMAAAGRPGRRPPAPGSPSAADQREKDFFHCCFSCSVRGKGHAVGTGLGSPSGSTTASAGRSRNRTACRPATPAHRSATAAARPGTQDQEVDDKHGVQVLVPVGR
jgi:hypothetical protein